MKRIFFLMLCLLAGFAFSAIAEGTPAATSAAIVSPEPTLEPYAFSDAELEAQVREQLGISFGLVSVADLESVTELNCASRWVQDLSDLKHMPNLKLLKLGGDTEGLKTHGWQGNAVTLDLSPLSSLRSLEYLNIDGQASIRGEDDSYITAELYRVDDLLPLKELDGLWYLNLSGCGVRDLSPLAGLTQLESLNLYKNDVDDLSPLAGLKALNYLDIDLNRVSDLTPLAGLDKLTTLSAGENEIADLSPLAKLHLAGLLVEGNAISDLAPLAHMTTLTWLNLRHNDISDLSPLSELTALEWLYLDANHITDIRPLWGLERLEFLSLQQNDVPDKDLVPMAFVPELYADKARDQ